VTADKTVRENKELDYKQNMGDYRQRKKDKLSVNRMWRDIRKCQRACEQLDKKKVHIVFLNPLTVYTCTQGYVEPEEYWYWGSGDGDENDEDEDYEVNATVLKNKSYINFKA